MAPTTTSTSTKPKTSLPNSPTSATTDCKSANYMSAHTPPTKSHSKCRDTSDKAPSSAPTSATLPSSRYRPIAPSGPPKKPHDYPTTASLSSASAHAPSPSPTQESEVRPKQCYSPTTTASSAESCQAERPTPTGTTCYSAHSSRNYFNAPPPTTLKPLTPLKHAPSAKSTP